MGIISSLMDFILHMDKHLSAIIHDFGAWTYVILFVIIFAETGLVVTPFLPGDSLLFAAGSFAGLGSIRVWPLFISLAIAAVLGDTINYSIGKFIGPKVFKYENSRIFRRDYLDKTNKFYEKYGVKTIILARFVPVVRTFAPFVAGIGKMEYFKFALYNVVGGVIWVALFVFGGYFFGNLPIVKRNFTLVILVIVALSFVPMAIEAWKHYRIKRKA